MRTVLLFLFDVILMSQVEVKLATRLLRAKTLRIQLIMIVHVIDLMVQKTMQCLGRVQVTSAGVHLIVMFFLGNF